MWASKLFLNGRKSKLRQFRPGSIGCRHLISYLADLRPKASGWVSFNTVTYQDSAVIKSQTINFFYGISLCLNLYLFQSILLNDFFII